MALHFALRNPQDDRERSLGFGKDDSEAFEDAFVYVLEPDRLSKYLNAIHAEHDILQKWKSYLSTYQACSKLNVENWEDIYLPSDGDERKELSIPTVPLVLDFPHITRRVAAQRSRFIVFGRDPEFLHFALDRKEPFIRCICIDGKYRQRIRLELRDCGVTESVIFPELDGLGREMKQLWEDRK